MARPRRALTRRDFTFTASWSWLAGFTLLVCLPGCIAIKVVDTAASAAVSAVETTVHVSTAAADAVIPDRDEDEQDDN